MAWHKKEAKPSFDEQPISGLFYLDGDVLARALIAQQEREKLSHPIYPPEYFKGMKYPQVAFPSGLVFEVWEGSQNPIIHLFGEMDLTLYSTRDEAFQAANDIAEACGYLAKPVGDNQLEVIGHERDEHLLITYDDTQKRMVNVMRPPREKREVAPPPPLLPNEIRAKLPPLYSQESKGLDAVAQVKFFHPSSQWTWYASEFDGKDTFFGLVSGFEVELGYFSLSELQEVQGGLGLPIERDRFFEPTRLRELEKRHPRRVLGDDDDWTKDL
jgi:Protein of unknown function (DUF2958)